MPILLAVLAPWYIIQLRDRTTEQGNREIRNQRKKTEAEGTKPEGGCQRSKSRTDPDDSGGGGEREAKPSKKREAGT